jgi:tetratricopeptide (TPR) repeat protein
MTIATKLTSLTIRVAAAGLGTAVAGPLGGAIGGWLATALDGPAHKVITDAAEKFGDKAAEKLLDGGADSLIDKFKRPSPQIEDAYRKALLMGLAEIQTRSDISEFGDWFTNWKECLNNPAPLNLEPIQPSRLVPENLDSIFRLTMESLDAQGLAIRQKKLSLKLATRTIPEALLATLTNQLPDRLQVNFRTLILKDEYGQAWRQGQLVFQDFVTTTLVQVADDAAITRKLVEGMAKALAEGKISSDQLRDKDAEIARLKQQLEKLEASVSARASEPAEAKLSNLLAAGDITGALKLKTRQVEARTREVAKLPRDLFELGQLYEIHFDWRNALIAYRKAWNLEHNSEFGLRLAYLAARQNRFDEAVTTYEALLDIYTDPGDVAGTLNNLAILCRATQRMKPAEEAYQEALVILRRLAESNPEAYLPDVAMTLNNLANLYRGTRRMKPAEEAYQEALVIRRKLAEANPETYLPNIATALNNLAVLYSATQRMKPAEEAYQEALITYRQLAEANPEAYLPDVAMTLNNLAVLYSDMQRIKPAEEAYQEALVIRRQLAGTNPETYLPKVAMTLNNLAILYRATQRVKSAEEAYQEALVTYRRLAEANPEAYLPDVATTLNNLAILYSNTQRMKPAEEAYHEALVIRRQLAEANPEAYLPDVAGTLNNLAILYSNTQRTKAAAGMCNEANAILEPLWQVSPQLHGDQMGRILCLDALIGEQIGRPTNEICASAKRALRIAYDPHIKKGAQVILDRLGCQSDVEE